MSSQRSTEARRGVNWAEKIQLGDTREWVLARGSDARNPALPKSAELALGQTRGRAAGSARSAQDQDRRGWQL
jgi:hypothetical protein